MSDMSQNTVPGQGYGEQAEQRRQLEQLPMGPAPRPNPQQPPRLTAPSARPNEPVQAGLPMGAGPGPEALGTMDGQRLTRQTLQAMLRRFPSPALRKMLMDMER